MMLFLKCRLLVVADLVALSDTKDERVGRGVTLSPYTSASLDLSTTNSGRGTLNPR